MILKSAKNLLTEVEHHTGLLSLDRWVTVSIGVCAIIGFFSTDAVGIPVSSGSGAVIIEQVDFRGGADSGVGEITVNRSLANSITGLTAGYINVTNSSGEWLVRNLPVISDSTSDSPSITTRFDLGVANGNNVSAINLSIDYSSSPSVLFSGGPTSSFSVTPTVFAAGGVGDVLLDHYLPGPDLAGVNFALGGPTFHFQQKGHKNEQAARNQCAPMAVANSLQFLEDTQGLKVPQDHKKGIRNDLPGDVPGENDALVSELEKAMNRDVVSRTRGHGVWPLDGKLKYLRDNGLAEKLVIKHRGDGSTGGDPNVALDGTKDITRYGVTSNGQGARVTWAWLMNELLNGEDVELDIHFSGPLDGRHYVKVVGGGMILGLPYITHVSDHTQSDMDPTDTLGTDKLDHAFMIDDALIHIDPLLSSWNGRVDQAISESVIPEPSTLLLLGAGIAGVLGFVRVRGRREA